MLNENYSERMKKIIEYSEKIDADRNARWVSISHALASYDQYMMVVSQGLGKLDSKLVIEDDLIKNQDTSNPFGDMSEHFTISYLWVLGAYEVIRSLSQRTTERDDFLPFQKNKLQELKRRFERLRIPLAKFEAARHHSETDSHIAYPAINTEQGAAWQVAENTWITRRELSDSMLELFESINA